LSTAVVEIIILKCTHTIIFGDLNYINYTKCEDVKYLKSFPVPDIIFLKLFT